MLYVNGIALGVLELKRSIVSVAEGIRQNLDNQKKEFIRPFFTTVQLVHGGNDTEGLRYGVDRDAGEVLADAGRKPSAAVENPLDRATGPALQQGAAPGADPRLHGLRRRHQEDLPPQPVLRRPGGAGARAAARGRHHLAHPGQRQEPDDGLARQVDPRARARTARVLIITDRTELDEQIEKVFKGVNEDIYRTKSGADLVASAERQRRRG